MFGSRSFTKNVMRLRNSKARLLLVHTKIVDLKFIRSHVKASVAYVHLIIPYHTHASTQEACHRQVFHEWKIWLNYIYSIRLPAWDAVFLLFGQPWLSKFLFDGSNRPCRSIPNWKQWIYNSPLHVTGQPVRLMTA